MLSNYIYDIADNLGSILDGIWSYQIDSPLGQNPYACIEVLLNNVVVLFAPLLVIALVCCVIRIVSNFWGYLTDD